MSSPVHSCCWWLNPCNWCCGSESESSCSESSSSKSSSSETSDSELLQCLLNKPPTSSSIISTISTFTEKFFQTLGRGKRPPLGRALMLWQQEGTQINTLRQNATALLTSMQKGGQGRTQAFNAFMGSLRNCITPFLFLKNSSTQQSSMDIRRRDVPISEGQPSSSYSFEDAQEFATWLQEKHPETFNVVREALEALEGLCNRRHMKPRQQGYNFKQLVGNLGLQILELYRQDSHRKAL